MPNRKLENLKPYEVVMSSLLVDARTQSGLSKIEIARRACLAMSELESAELTPTSVPCFHLHSIALVYGFELSQRLNHTMAEALSIA